MDLFYFFVLLLTVMILAYKHVPLLMAMSIMVGLTVMWTELRHVFTELPILAHYIPSWFRFANGIIAVKLIGF